MKTAEEIHLTLKRKAAIHTLLKGIETGDPASVEVVNQDKYIQHNPQTAEGGEGLAALFKRLSKTAPKVNIVRLFSDGDFVFGHTEYEFSVSRVGFEVFRFEGDQAVEHWDNIQSRLGPNESGHSMVDGSTNLCDLEKTEDNRALVTQFVDKVLIGRQVELLESYVAKAYTEHNPSLADSLQSLLTILNSAESKSQQSVCYEKRHRVLAEGNFVLSVCEGKRGDDHISFYDLFRIEDSRIVEHWDTTERIAPRSEWKNDNGKF